MKRIHNLSSAKIGDIIAYRLSPTDQPTDPNQLWHGIVKLVYTNPLRRVTGYLVESQEYPDCDENVSISQVMSIERKQVANS